MKQYPVKSSFPKIYCKLCSFASAGGKIMVSRVLLLLMRCFGEFKTGRDGEKMLWGILPHGKRKTRKTPIPHAQESSAKGTKISLDTGLITFHERYKSGLQ